MYYFIGSKTKTFYLARPDGSAEQFISLPASTPSVTQTIDSTSPKLLPKTKFVVLSSKGDGATSTNVMQTVQLTAAQLKQLMASSNITTR